MRSDYEKVKAAIEYVRACASEQPSLQQIAERVSLSPPYLQRLFRWWAGISPKRWLYGWHDSPFGHCLVGLTARGICALRFADSAEVGTETDRLQEEWSKAHLANDPKKTAEIVTRIFETGRNRHLLLDLKGTNFQLRVWEALLQIPEGCVISYGDLANRLGSPTASRAVARAVGANPIAFLIPCHRVLRGNGDPGGYRWGVDRKSVMLARELPRSNKSPERINK